MPYIVHRETTQSQFRTDKNIKFKTYFTTSTIFLKNNSASPYIAQVHGNVFSKVTVRAMETRWGARLVALESLHLRRVLTPFAP